MVAATKAAVIIVPDGLAYDTTTGTAKAQPSFVYRAVLEWVKRELPHRVVYLAPANRFGGTLYEQEAAAEVLLDYSGTVICVPSRGLAYIDTRGNAAQLRDYLVAQALWPLSAPALLVSATLHRARASLCFRKEGFALAASIGVHYSVPDHEPIVPRLWYYRHPNQHHIYEIAAYIRDWMRPARQEG